MNQEKIDISRLVPMDLFTDALPLRIDLAYAGPHNFCGITIYRKEARLWLHEDLAAVVLKAAQLCHQRHNLRTVIYDGLRTVSAQQLMQESPPVRAHPQWLREENRVLAPPGHGAHPRAMAIDISLETNEGVLLDMGTAFDEMPENGNGPEENRAHRQFIALPDSVKNNRRILEDTMLEAAKMLGFELIALQAEWWDFRFPAAYSNRFAALDEEDLPPQMRMTARSVSTEGPPDFSESHFRTLKDALLSRLT